MSESDIVAATGEDKAQLDDRGITVNDQGEETRRKAFVRKWRLKCRAVADSLAEAGDKLFTFTRLSKSQWKRPRVQHRPINSDRPD